MGLMSRQLRVFRWVVLMLLTGTEVGFVPQHDYYKLNEAAFFSLPAVRERINLLRPDYYLLDAALFHATNEARRSQGLQPFQFHPALHQAARQHAENMIQLDFYGHVNPFNPMEGTADKRIWQQSRAFERVAENIAQYQTIDTPDLFYVRRHADGMQYEYLEMQTMQHCQPYSYAGYARYAVQTWMDSYGHRLNLLQPAYTHVACAAALSRNPYAEKRAPFGRLVQNFGSLNKAVTDTR